VARILRRQKKKTIRAMADKMADALKAGQQPSDVTFPHDGDLQTRVHSELARVHQFGVDQVRAEHARLLENRKSKIENRNSAAASGQSAIDDRQSTIEEPWKFGEGTGSREQGTGDGAVVILADGIQNPKSKIENRPSLHAEIAVEDYENRLADATRNVANDLRRSQDIDGLSAAELADEIFGAVGDYSEGFIDRAAQEGVRAELGAGRNEGFDESQEELEENGGFYERSCLLDKNTCPPCEAHDGERIEATDGPPEETADDGICEGGPECRCHWYEVMKG